MTDERRDSAPRPSADRLARRALAALDAVIVAYAVLGLLYLVTGGFDLGLLSVRRFSKPVLLLLILASLRAAIPRPSWLTRGLGAGALRVDPAVPASGRP